MEAQVHGLEVYFKLLSVLLLLSDLLLLLVPQSSFLLFELLLSHSRFVFSALILFLLFSVVLP